MMRAVLDASRDNSSPVWGRLGGGGLVVTFFDKNKHKLIQFR